MSTLPEAEETKAVRKAEEILEKFGVPMHADRIWAEMEREGLKFKSMGQLYNKKLKHIRQLQNGKKGSGFLILKRWDYKDAKIMPIKSSFLLVLPLSK